MCSIRWLQYDFNCIANLLDAGMQSKADMLKYSEALDNLHMDIVLQLQAGADVKAVAAQVRPAAMLCISAVLLSRRKLFQDKVLLQHMQPSDMHV